MRRPLCGAAILLFLICLIIVTSSRNKTEFREDVSAFTGVVARREQKGDMEVYDLKDTSVSKTGRILVYLKNSKCQYFIGSTLMVYGKIVEYESPGNPGQFDSRSYYAVRNVVGRCYAERVEVVDDSVDWWSEGLCSIREFLGTCLEKRYDLETAGMLKAMLLGIRSGVPEKTKKLYESGGISHLLAISGLHISILGMGLYRGLRKAGAGYGWAGIPSVLLLILYGNMIDAGASTLRAILMFGLMIGADLIGRTYDTKTALAVAAIGLMVVQPLYAVDSGFLLSFGAVFGLAQWNEHPGKWKKWLVPVAIEMATLPVIMESFFEVPLYSPVLNLLVVPLMPFALVFGVLGMLIKPAAWAATLLLRVVETLAGYFVNLPMATIVTGAPSSWQVGVYYVGLLGLLFLGQRRGSTKRMGLRVGIALFCLLQLFWRREAPFTMTMLDVGQGDGLYVSTRGGNTFLIDGGSSDEANIGEYILEPFLKHKGKRKVDYWLISHGDRDHISGVREVLEGGLLEVGCLVLPVSARGEEDSEALAQIAMERGICVRFMKAGDCLIDGELEIQCLSPEEGVDYGTENAGSMVLGISYGSLRVLLTGDLEGKGESLLLREDVLEAGYDILKVAHHGSRDATLDAFLAVVKPKISLISCGEENSYGHPHKELLERLYNAGSRIYDTSGYGAITVTSDGTRYQINTFRNI